MKVTAKTFSTSGHVKRGSGVLTFFSTLMLCELENVISLSLSFFHIKKKTKALHPYSQSCPVPNLLTLTLSKYRALRTKRDDAYLESQQLEK